MAKALQPYASFLIENNGDKELYPMHILLVKIIIRVVGMQ